MFREIVTETLDGWGLPAAPEALDRLERYCALLLQKNEVMNLTAAKTPEEVARRHISDSLFLLKCTELTHKSILDLGTGAGFPGLPLKLYDPALDVTLLDSRGKRIDFIREVLDDLGITDANETDVICSAIWHHDSKGQVDSPMDEVLKDADVIHHSLGDPTKEVKEREKARFAKLSEEFDFCSSW